MKEMIKKKFNQDIYYQYEEMSNQFLHIFSTKIGFIDENDSMNRIFDTDRKVISLKQIHGDKVFIVDEDFLKNYDASSPFKGDALVTDRNDIFLKTFHADCLPIYITDEKKNVAGVVHSGHRGTFLNILAETLNVFVNHFGSSKEDIKLFFGPSIRDCCYEFGKDLIEKFEEKYDYKDYYFKRDGKYYLDVNKVNVEHALDFGVSKKNMYNTALCTGCMKDIFYSYRMEKAKGRLIAVIGLR